MKKGSLLVTFVCVSAATLVLLGVYSAMEKKLLYGSLTFLVKPHLQPLPVGDVRADPNSASETSPSVTATDTTTRLGVASPSKAPAEQSSPKKKQTIPRLRETVVSSSERWYLLRGFEGRLGNVLFQFSSAVCIATLNNLTLVVQDVGEMRSLRYRGLRVPPAAWKEALTMSPLQRHKVDTCCRFDATVMSLTPPHSHHSLTGYFQSWRYWEPCRAQVKEATLFKDSILAAAAAVVAELRKTLPGRTLVGIHVRREDFLKPAEQKGGKKVAPPDYFLRAMTYFREKFSDVTFVAGSSDPDWFRTEVSNSSQVVHLKRSSSAAVDMEVLSRMDHMIVSVGTFGWWCAYRNKGAVVYYKDFYVPGSKYGLQFRNNTGDHFPPQWIPL